MFFGAPRQLNALRRARSSPQALSVEGLYELTCKVRTLAFLLVFEIDVDVPARGCLVPNGMSPAHNVGRLIPLVAQTEVAVVGRDLERYRPLFAVGDAQRQVPCAQAVVDRVFEPGAVPELKGRAQTLGQVGQKRVQQRQVFAQVGRQLEEYRAELRSERDRGVEKIADQIRAVTQPSVVGNTLGRLQRELEMIRRLAVPAG